jgi:EAL domain-containing protein (putative c-di-GMP-specific phosphodiesterase class I)
MAAGLRMEVIAEGVETAGQATLLHDMGCRIGQGYLWSKPVPACNLDALLGLARQSA